MESTTRRRLLGLLVAVTVGLLVADLAGWAGADTVRRAGGAVFGPVQRALSGAPPDELARLAAENVRLRETNAAQTRELEGLTELRRLLGTEVAGSHRLVGARVVATALSPLGGRSLTLDAGSRDGVVTDVTVMSADGLVGRVVAVSPWTCDVQVLGSAGSVVGVRVGTAGTMGTVAASSAGTDVTRARGTLVLALVEPGTPAVGDLVRTLGSIDERPYAAGLVVGTVTAVDPDRGGATRTATVVPAVDPDAVDVVGVLLPTARATPRATSGAGATG
ncbi:MAG: rod shape-determining protein MreC [Terracoccus sp.]